MWTPDALRSEGRAFASKVWRVVEAQHKASTMKLVDDLDEQRLLEEAIEASKPLVPEPCRPLHPLLHTPFRYAPYPRGSRFRRAHQREGVFYAALEVETAIAETAFYALLFYRESPETKLPKRPTERTAFQVPVATQQALDLTVPPLDRDRASWQERVDYTACQGLADAARVAGIEAMLYASVRDPMRGQNVALLDCRCFRSREPVATESWHVFVRPDRVDARCEFPDRALPFPQSLFADDPRMRGTAG